MTRVFLSLDESNPQKPVAVLHVNGQELHLSELEVYNLNMEIHWAREHIAQALKNNWKNLATKYKEIQNA